MSSSLLDLVPPRLQHRRPEIADEVNAWYPWVEACEAFVGDADRIAWSWPPEEDESRPVEERLSESESRKLIADNQATIVCLDQGIERGAIRVPDQITASQTYWWPAIGNGPLMPRLRELLRLVSLRAQMRLADGDVASAVDDCVRLLRSGMILFDGLVIDALLASNFIAIGMFRARNAADHPGASLSHLKPLLKEIAACHDLSRSFAKSMSIELCEFAMWHLDKFDQAERVDPTALVNAMFASDGELPDEELDLDDGEYLTHNSRYEVQRYELKACLTFALRDHQAAYDRDQTVAWLGEATQLAQRSLSRPQKIPWHWFRQQCANWYDRWRTHRLRKATEILPFWIWKLNQSVPDELADQWFAELQNELDLRSLRSRTQRARNPVGAWLYNQNSSGVRLASCFHLNQGAAGITLLIVALRIHQLEHGRLPRDLKGLVKTGILPALPLDPYTGRQYLYNAQEGYVWSAGDATDPSRWSEKEGEPATRRLAWQLKSHRPQSAA